MTMYHRQLVIFNISLYLNSPPHITGNLLCTELQTTANGNMSSWHETVKGQELAPAKIVGLI